MTETQNEAEEQKIKDAIRLKISALTARAHMHGVDLVAGESVITTVEKLVKRLDEYRDLPDNKGRVLVE